MVDCLTTELPFRLVGGLSTGGVYALIAIGYTLVYGVLQLINFAHSEVFMSGVLAGALILGAVAPDGATSQAEGALFLAISLVPAMLVSGSLAVAVERVAYRPLRKRGAPRLAYLISAIGMSLFLSYAVQVWRGVNPEAYPRTLRAQAVLQIGDVRIFNRDLIIVVSAAVMVIALEMFVRRTRTGRALRATAQDPEAAALMGVNIDRIVTVTFFIGGLLAGAAGLLFGMAFGRSQWNIGFLPGIKAFTAAVLGGIGSIRGALAGGLILGVMENVSAGCFGTQWRDVVAFILLVGVLMVRPTGIFGDRT
ncbi:MAG TPA: branched-chain amino acid ABC transporter permease [Actinomycetota bacterium]|jgi:branched-chain amino acid transport system permease protein|nr:branched-chain amino acid ABC transporter permease [Actinomycetota bacterium]